MSRKRIPLKAASVIMAAAVAVSSASPALPYVYAAETETEVSSEAVETLAADTLPEETAKTQGGTNSETEPEEPIEPETPKQEPETPAQEPETPTQTETTAETGESDADNQTDGETEEETAGQTENETETAEQTEKESESAGQTETGTENTTEGTSEEESENLTPVTPVPIQPNAVNSLTPLAAPEDITMPEGGEMDAAEAADAAEADPLSITEDASIVVDFVDTTTGEGNIIDVFGSDTLRDMLNNLFQTAGIADGYSDGMSCKWSQGGTESNCNVSDSMADVFNKAEEAGIITLNVYGTDGAILAALEMTATTDGDTNTLSISAALKAQEVSVINISCGDTVYLTSSYDLNQVIFGILATTGYIDYDPSQETTGGSGEGELSKADGVEIDVIEKSSGLRECLTDDDSFTGANLFNLAMKSQTANIYSLYRDGKELVRVELTAMKVESDTGTGRSLQINKLSLPGDCTITYNLNGGSLASGGSTTSLRGNGDKIGSFDITGDDISSSSAFIGWFTAANGGREVFSTETVTGSMTLYAHYASMPAYSVTFDWGFAPNFGEDGSTYSETYNYEVMSNGTYWLGDVPTPNRSGQTFLGWFTASGDPLKATDASNNTNRTFYAKYSSSAPGSVTYHMNDGSGRSFKVNQTAVGYYANASGGRGEEIDLSSYSSNQFKGWAASEDGGILENGTTVSAGTNLYAIWGDTVTISFNSGYSQFQYDPIMVQRGKPISDSIGDTIPDDYELPKPSLEGHEFTGWYTESGARVTMNTVFAQNTVLTAHWDTETYTVTFDANEGTLEGDDEVEIEQGARIGALPTPTRTDYSFLGWYTKKEGGTIITESTRVTKDVTYYAHWAEKVYMVTFDATEGYVDGSSVIYVEPQSTVENIPRAFSDNKIFVGWFLDRDGEEAFTSETVITKDTIVYAVWEEITEDKTATITFDAAGGITPELTRNVVKGTAIGALPEPTYEGYSFLGWFTRPQSGIRITSDSVVNSDTILYAHWAEGENPVTSIRLNYDHLDVKFGDDLGLQYSYSPIDADNANFYWTSSDETVIKVSGDNEFTYVGPGTTTLTIHTIDNSVEASCTVTVTREPILVKEIAFDEPEQTVTIGDGIDLSVTYSPKGAENAEFVWSSSNEDIIRVTEDGQYWSYGGDTGTVQITIATTDGKASATCTITVNPKETKPTDPEEFKYTIRFNTNGGSAVEPITVKDGEKISDLPETTKDGYTFLGWFTANGKEVTEITGSANMTLYAHWEKEASSAKEEATVIFDAQNGEPVTTKTYEEGEALGALPEVTYDGHTLKGWFTAAKGGMEVTADTKVTEDMTIYAQWEAAPEEYVLKLNPAGGQINGSSTVLTYEDKLQEGSESGNDISDITVTRQGYTFLGWYSASQGGELVYGTDGKAVNGSFWTDGKYTEARNLTVYAQWEKNVEEFTLYCNSRGGSLVETKTYAEGTTVTEFETPVREGYTFLGWFTHPTTGEKVESVYMDSNKVIYAHWQKDETAEEKKSYTITFDAQGGTEVESVTKEEGTAIELPETAKEGFVFDGWYTEAEGGIKLSSITITKDMTVYAHWSEVPEPTIWKLTFNFMDGRLEEKQVTDGETVEEFPEAVREGYTFLGWYDAMEGGSKVESCTVSANTTLYARWEAIQDETPSAKTFTITLDAQGGKNNEAVADGVLKVEAGTKVTMFPEPTKDGYTFLGWFTKPTGGYKVISVTARSNVTLYAHWEEMGAEGIQVSTLILNEEKMTIKYGTSPLGLTYKYGPANAENAVFKWTSSNPDVIDVVENENEDGTVTQTFRYTGIGETTMTIATEDGTISDSCIVTVTPAAVSAGTGAGSGITTGPTGSWTGTAGTGTGPGSGVTADDKNDEVDGVDGSENKDEEAVERISLTVTTETGSIKDVTVNADVKLSALAKKLGYDVSAYMVSLADGEKESIPEDITIGELAEKAANGDLVLTAYDAYGEILGTANVSKNADGYDVVIKSASSASETDQENQEGNGNTGTPAATSASGGTAAGSVSDSTEDGNDKGNSTTDGVQTGDIPVWEYIAVAAVLAALIAVMAVAKRRQKKAEEAGSNAENVDEMEDATTNEKADSTEEKAGEEGADGDK